MNVLIVEDERQLSHEIEIFLTKQNKRHRQLFLLMKLMRSVALGAVTNYKVATMSVKTR